MNSGDKLGRYRVQSAIGAGGMGEVFLAKDTQLERLVALKVLPSEIATDEQRIHRFVQEARAASALNHPNILTIYEIGSFDESHFIASEYVKGKTLREMLETKALSICETLDIAAQITAALGAAHEAGIIHRDIKPENVMIREDGLVKVLDFGLAKLVEKTPLDNEAETKIQVQTQAGVILGTVAYMSPEQARGRELDRRTDIFSLGIVLYEMLTRQQPFTGETISHTIVAILEKEPPPLSKIIGDYPAEIERIIKKALAKNKEERYPNAKDLLTDLKGLQRRLEFEAEFVRSSSLSVNAEAQTQIIKVATGENASISQTTFQTNSIAVLPFANMSTDLENEYFCDGLAEELLNALGKIENLKVAARTSAFSFKGKNAQVSEIGRALGVNTVLEGSVRKAGNRLRITVQLVNAADGYHLWSERYDREMKDIFDVQDEITLAVTGALKVKLLGEEKALVLKRYTDSTEAYEAYLKGYFYYNKFTVEGWQKAIEYFEEAIRKEPEYAPAFAGIALCRLMFWFYGVIPPHEIVPLWREATRRALELDNDLAKAHLSLANIYFFYEWDWEKAEMEFQRALELNPNSADVYWWYGEFLASRERFGEAIEVGTRAVELDPLSLLAMLNTGWIYLFSDRLDDALTQARKMLEIEPKFHGAYWQLGAAYLSKGMYQEAVEAYEKSVALGGNQMERSGLSVAYSASGRRRQAEDTLDQLLELRKHQHISAFDLARAYSGLGEDDLAFEWLDKACTERNGEMVFLRREAKIGTGDIWGKSFRTDPRFQDILRRVGLPADDKPLNKTTSETSEAKTEILSATTIDTQETLTTITKTNEEQPIPEKTKQNWLLIALLSVLVITIGFFAYRYFAPASKQIESIAVLPFINEGGNADIEYLTDGMTETLIGSLSQLPKLSVKARSSVFRYKGKEPDAQTVGKELNVQAILTGRVVQRGQDLILYLELVDTQTENVLWKENYNKPMANLVALQREIALDVSQKLKTKLSGTEEQRWDKNYTANSEAYQLYLRGRFYWNKRTTKDLRKSIEYFDQAITIDPSFALAYAALADGYAILWSYGGAPANEAMPKAREFALKALSLDRDLTEARAALGYVFHFYDHNFAEAEREYKLSIELNPRYAPAHLWYGELLQQLGKHEAALEEKLRALELEPLSLIFNRHYGESLLFMRRYEEAITQFKKTVELDPSFVSAYTRLAIAYQLQGDYAESVEGFAKNQEISGERQTAQLLRESFAKGGWEGFLRFVTKQPPPPNYNSYYIATFHIALGEKDKAFAKLNKSYENREYSIVYLKVDPRLDPLRDDPRFEELLRRVGFPE